MALYFKYKKKSNLYIFMYSVFFFSKIKGVQVHTLAQHWIRPLQVHTLAQHFLKWPITFELYNLNLQFELYNIFVAFQYDCTIHIFELRSWSNFIRNFYHL